MKWWEPGELSGTIIAEIVKAWGFCSFRNRRERRE
jgi:hypothetical protein